MAKKLKINNYIGYAIADLGNNIGFSVTSAYLVLFYTDILGAHFDSGTASLWGIIIGIIMIVARIWDGINDPMMGFIAQNRKPDRFGKFRPFLIYGGIALATIFIIMFIPIKNMSLAMCTIFAVITYIAYGMIYTVVLVPYGSLATLMTRDETERSRLSIARSIGGGIGGIPAGMLFPSLVYSGAAEEKYLDGSKLFIAVIIIAVIMVTCYTVAFFNVKEQYPYAENTEKIHIGKTLKSIIHNKPFILMSIAGMLLIASSMFINSIDIYLFNVYYLKSGFMTYVTIATYIPMVIMIPFTGKIIKAIGKKEMSIISLSVATLSSFIMMVWRIPDPYIFILFTFFQGCGTGFLTLEIWALAMDVIDYEEMLTGKREEATSYAIFTFMRKIGQALAATVTIFLSLVGYVSSLGYSGQSQATAEGIYTVATVVPFILFSLMLITLIFYPLNKKKDREMRERLKELRKNEESKE